MAHSLERIEFDDPQQPYDAYLMSQHLVRYAAAMPFLRGKKVLDVACGSGYGAKIMVGWGAKEVVGVDISETAIQSAKQLFGSKKLRYIVGNAEALSDVLDAEERFDVVTCFETIEHINKPEALLKAIKTFTHAGSIVLVSCPNDAVFSQLGMQSEFHVRSYGFNEFKELTEAHLGPADDWLFGAPTYGEINFRANTDVLARAVPENMSVFKHAKIANVLQIPSQSNTQPDDSSVSHFIGVWGSKAVDNAVVIAQSVNGFVEPWRAIKHYQAQISALEQKSAAQAAELAVQRQQSQEHEAVVDQMKQQLESGMHAHRENNTKLEAELERVRVAESQLRLRCELINLELQEQRERTLQLAADNGELKSRLQALTQDGGGLHKRVMADLQQRVEQLTKAMDDRNRAGWRGSIAKLFRQKND